MREGKEKEGEGKKRGREGRDSGGKVKRKERGGSPFPCEKFLDLLMIFLFSGS